MLQKEKKSSTENTHTPYAEITPLTFPSICTILCCVPEYLHPHPCPGVGDIGHPPPTC